MENGSVADISFYALVHHVLEASREDDAAAERRTGRRRSYSCLQWIAPYIDGKLPAADEFRRVQCVDLSSSGFSYLTDDSADYEYVVVALGSPATHFLSGEIVRRTAVPHEGKNCVRMGCRFVARLDEASYRPNLLATSMSVRV